MNENVIKFNEQSNDGSAIHLYQERESGVWIAYGYSAYALRLIVKRKSLNCLRRFSEQIQLPCTIVESNVLKKLESEDNVQKQQTDYGIVLFSVCTFDQKEYVNWENKLKEEINLGGRFNTTPHVSHLVPKDQYIKDSMSSFARNSKRLLDLLSSFVALVIFSPLFLLCYILVRREDGGPAIYKQERIGRFGHPFNIYKFRTMRLDAEKLGPQLSHSGGEDDPRLTKIGKFLRAHHLDELPQLWNVFVGDMAIVGPRPERKFFIELILEYDKRYEYLYQIRPGVTSYATFYNGYTDTMEKMLRRLEYDLYYLGHRSWFFDLKILMMTFLAIVFGKKF